MELRPYQTADRDALIDLWFESWRSIGLERPVVTRADLAQRTPLDLAERWTVTIAEAESRLVGFLAVCCAERRLDQLFVHPSAQGRGLGSALFEVAKQQLSGGFWLSTQPANRRARAFYERRGMTVDAVHPATTGDRVIYVSACRRAAAP